MNCILQQSRRYISTTISKPQKFHLIPYELQYESRDNENEIKRRNIKIDKKKQIQIKKFIDDYHPYLTKEDNVSDNLGPKLKYYYQNKYKNK
jgi:hypothetical protein